MTEPSTLEVLSPALLREIHEEARNERANEWTNQPINQLNYFYVGIDKLAISCMSIAKKGSPSQIMQKPVLGLLEYD